MIYQARAYVGRARGYLQIWLYCAVSCYAVGAYRVRACGEVQGRVEATVDVPTMEYWKSSTMGDARGIRVCLFSDRQYGGGDVLV
ncbi:hypothetical protein C8Q77DRAFT_652317 [Trametes polyzona]|nr:hypothetical protein C8Q77DRAFT_652317 [Trametes polyzona]